MSTKVAKIVERDNQLTPATDYDVNRMIFSDPVAGSVPNTPIVYRRVNISTLNKDGSQGDLIFPTERIFSFGVSENINPETKKINGHVFPLCLWDKNGATTAEKAWTDTFERVVEQCKKHLVDNREELELYDLSMSDLKKFNPLYYKKEKGKVVEGAKPTLYAKIIASKKHDKILTQFFNTSGESVDPMSLLGKYCYARAAVKIESIFIGSKITLQVKLYEAEVELMESGMRSLLPRPQRKQKMLTGSGTNMNEMREDDEDEGDGEEVKAPSEKAPTRAPVKAPVPAKKAPSEKAPPPKAEEEDAGSVENSEVEEEEKPAKPTAPPKRVVKKVVKK